MRELFPEYDWFHYDFLREAFPELPEEVLLERFLELEAGVYALLDASLED